MTCALFLAANEAGVFNSAVSSNVSFAAYVFARADIVRRTSLEL